jgi:hypothetical protein
MNIYKKIYSLAILELYLDSPAGVEMPVNDRHRLVVGGMTSPVS